MCGKILWLQKGISLKIMTDLYVFMAPSYCDVLRVILTPTCRMSRYPRQLIKVDAA
jgi:hypothetical protein